MKRLDAFNEKDQQKIVAAYQKYYPGTYERSLRIYDRCWNVFQRRHNGITKPIFIPTTFAGCASSLLTQKETNLYAVTLQPKLCIEGSENQIVDMVLHELCHIIWVEHTSEFWKELDVLKRGY